MFFAHGRDYVNPYYNVLEILKFEKLTFTVSLFTHKNKNDKINTPVVILNILTPATEIHLHNNYYVANQNLLKPSVLTNLWYIFIEILCGKNLSYQNINVSHTCS